MRNIREFLEWAATHAVLRETGGNLLLEKTSGLSAMSTMVPNGGSSNLFPLSRKR